MILMPANSTGWFWHCLARETNKIGHLFSPGSQRGPWPWFPFALDNGAFTCWNPVNNSFSEEQWKVLEPRWKEMLFWSTSVNQKPMWAIAPDRPGDDEETIRKWYKYSGIISSFGIPLAIAAQDGMLPCDIRALEPQPAVIAVGGSTEWKWETIEMWVNEFPRVHLLRCNMPDRLSYLESIGIESTDGTGWNRGNRKQTQGVEEWARGLLHRHEFPLHPHVCREPKYKAQFCFS